MIKKTVDKINPIQYLKKKLKIGLLLKFHFVHSSLLFADVELLSKHRLSKDKVNKTFSIIINNISTILEDKPNLISVCSF